MQDLQNWNTWENARFVVADWNNSAHVFQIDAGGIVITKKENKKNRCQLHTVKLQNTENKIGVIFPSLSSYIVSYLTKKKFRKIAWNQCWAKRTYRISVIYTTAEKKVVVIS